MNRTKKRTIANNNQGFTLVEVLVAAVIMSIAIISLVMVIRKGRDMDINDLHRRQARALICGKLESQEYQCLNYSKLVPKDTTVSDTLDMRSGTNPLVDSLKTRIVDTTVNTIPVKKVTISAWWLEGSYNDTITIEKWLAQAL